MACHLSYLKSILSKKNSSIVLLAALYLIHIAYDCFSEDLTNNIGVFYPYRQFCSVYDLLVGCFLFYYAFHVKKNTESSANL